jgi:hypothetical protein
MLHLDVYLISALARPAILLGEKVGNMYEERLC